MRQHDRLFDPRLMTQRRGASTFIRKGQSGTWVAELSPAVAAELQRRMETTSARLRARGAIVDSLFSSAPECRGTIQVRLRPGGHDTLVVSREGRPEGVRLAQHVVLPKLERRAAAALARFGLSSGRLTVRAARRAGVDKGAQVRLAIHGSPSDRVLEVDGIVEACEVTGRFLVLRVMFQGLERSEEMVLHQISSVTAEMASPIASQPSGYVSSATP
jgi:hypothetical protein